MTVFEFPPAVRGSRYRDRMTDEERAEYHDRGNEQRDSEKHQQWLKEQRYARIRTSTDDELRAWGTLEALRELDLRHRIRAGTTQRIPALERPDAVVRRPD